MDKQEFVDFYREYRDSDDTDKKQSHEEYRTMLDRVKKIRTSLLHDGKSLNRNDHENFLNDLLLSFYPGIANAGKGRLSFDEYIAMVDDAKVLHTLEEVIKEPNADTGEDLRIAIRDSLPENKYLIANRVLAASTKNVSSVVDRTRFSLVFDFLLENKIINPYSNRRIPKISPSGKSITWSNEEMRVTHWYEENCYLVEEVKKTIQSIDGEEPEIFHLLTFPWKIWKKYLEEIYREALSTSWMEIA